VGGLHRNIGGSRVALLVAALVAAIVTVTLAVAAWQPPTAAAASACKRWGDKIPGQLSPKHARKAVICLINERRRSKGRGGIDGDGRLNRAARSHSNYMVRHRCFSHQCGGEASLEGRLRRVGYVHNGLSRWAAAENIAWGKTRRGTPRAVVRSWMRSSGHRNKILSGTFEDIGVGFKHGNPNGSSGGTYTADFGMRRG
jgi:uncharacterized protein YkwD